MELNVPPLPEESTFPARRPWPIQLALAPFVLIGGALCWLAGASPRILKTCRSERMRYFGLGLAVLLTGLFGGVAAAIATGYFMHRPASRMWPAGLLWAIAIVNIDRLLIMVGGSPKRLLASMPFRALLAVPVGVLFAELLLMAGFQGEEDALIGTQQQTQVTQQIQHLEAFYQPKIQRDLRGAAAAERQIQARQQQITTYNYIARCEATQTDCSLTHLLTCGPVCQHYQDLATTATADLATVKPALLGEISRDQADAGLLDSRRLADEKAARATIAASNGLGAHKQALDELERRSSGIRFFAWLLRICLIMLDLAPVLLKALFVLTGHTLYEEALKARQAVERTNIHRQHKSAWLRTRSIDRRIDARDEVDEAQVDAERDRLIDETMGMPYRPKKTGRPSDYRPSGPEIPALSLSEFMTRSRRHESRPVPIQRPLTRAAWIGTGLIAAVSGTLLGLLQTGHHVADLTWPTLGLLALVCGLAAYTKGFRLAPAWAQRAAFGTALAGFFLPLVLFAIQL